MSKKLSQTVIAGLKQSKDKFFIPTCQAVRHVYDGRAQIRLRTASVSLSRARGQGCPAAAVPDGGKKKAGYFFGYPALRCRKMRKRVFTVAGAG